MVSGFRRVHRAVRVVILIILLSTAPGIMMQGHAQTAAPLPQSEKIDQLLKLLEDPEVKSWIAGKPAAPTKPTIEDTSAGPVMLWANGLRDHLKGLVHAIPVVPEEIRRSNELIKTTLNGFDIWAVLALFAGLAGIGRLAETAFRRWALPRQQVPPIHSQSAAASPPIAASIFTALAPLVLFAFVSVGGFLIVEWPPLLGPLMLSLLGALIAWRLIVRMAKALLAPDNDEQRVLAMDGVNSSFWFTRIKWFAAVFFTGWAVAGLMRALSFTPGVRGLIIYAIGIGLLAIALETIWHHPKSPAPSEAQRIKKWALTFYVCLIWVLWVGGLSLTMWIGIYILVLPPLLRTTTSLVKRSFARRADPIKQTNPLYEVLAERGARLVIIVLALIWLGVTVRARAVGLLEDETTRQILRGVFGGVVILLAADMIWHIVKGVINRRIEQARLEAGDEAALARSGRLMTLLPILRNFLAAFIIALAIMMILSGLGIEIAPLIAGAGIFGVAIGFGSQTLVKDVISGVFYMTDDAFRVGEYIQSGSYKGTVESFSIRSVKLRHHRGPIFTVPFGSLGAVQNMSRDWVIDKFLISVNYDTDIAKVKKVVKGVGAALLEDNELGPHIIETVKMKGVETFGDYGINLSFAMMTKPGHQSTIRRRAYAMIREAFTANGIGFASPTVQVAGSDEQSTNALAAATQNTVARKKAADTLKLVEEE